jgi:hypothetical protein
MNYHFRNELLFKKVTFYKLINIYRLFKYTVYKLKANIRIKADTQPLRVGC